MQCLSDNSSHPGAQGDTYGRGDKSKPWNRKLVTKQFFVGPRSSQLGQGKLEVTKARTGFQAVRTTTLQ